MLDTRINKLVILGCSFINGITGIVFVVVGSILEEEEISTNRIFFVFVFFVLSIITLVTPFLLCYGTIKESVVITTTCAKILLFLAIVHLLTGLKAHSGEYVDIKSTPNGSDYHIIVWDSVKYRVNHPNMYKLALFARDWTIGLSLFELINCVFSFILAGHLLRVHVNDIEHNAVFYVD